MSNSDDFNESSVTGGEIAVIGMVCRFPGAKDIDEFWDNLKSGRESTAFFTDEDLKELGITAKTTGKSDYIRAYGWLEDIEYFDATFFDYSPVEAELMDPQMYVFHECVWAALESAGYDCLKYRRPIGLYAGAIANLLWQSQVLASEKMGLVGEFPARQLHDKDYLATRVANRLDLKGPAITVDTACSTSLVAIHLACQGLLGGDCDIAVAGGSSIPIVHKMGYFYQEGMVKSSDGHTRSFDSKARGSVFGNGVGVVVLKRLVDAVNEGDFIHAVIKGSAINNDGARKSAYTAPSIEGQAEVIRTAHRLAEVRPETCGYVETHGTGTPLGDPVEIEGLKAAFKTDKKQFIRIGSVKSNFGHLEAAAGAAGFIKTVLILKHQMIPPSLFFETPNPKIGFADSAFIVNTGLTPWPHDSKKYPRRAGVSSFGIGGTNVHVVLEEAVAGTYGIVSYSGSQSSLLRKNRLILLSARTETALEKMTLNLAQYFRNHPGTRLADAAFTLQVGRHRFRHRRMLVCPDMQEAVEILSSPDSQAGKMKTHDSQEDIRSVVFMFAGPGSQYVNMGRDLYEREPVFRREMDSCFKILEGLQEYEIKEILYPGQGEDSGQRGAAPGIEQTEIAALVIFVFEYALAQLLMHWGIKPMAMIGYGVSEIIAACIAGVFSLEQALAMAVYRGKAQETALAGGFREKVAGFKLNKPEIPLISNVTGQWLSAEEAENPVYWARPLTGAVKFADGLKELLSKKKAILVEIGPGQDLRELALRYLEGEEEKRVLSLVRQSQQQVADDDFLLGNIGWLWLYGYDIDWNGFHSQEKLQRIPLPTYPFEGKRYWFLKKGAGAQPRTKGAVTASAKKEDIADFFYIPSWKRSITPCTGIGQAGSDSAGIGNWLFFMDEGGLEIGRQLVRQLGETNPQDKIAVVLRGKAFTRVRTGGDADDATDIYTYTVNPEQAEDYGELLAALQKADRLPQRIIHLWHITGPDRPDRMAEDSYRGFFSLLYLAQALGLSGIEEGDERVCIAVVTDNMQAVTGEEELCPGKAALLGPMLVIPEEYANIRCSGIDVVLPAGDAGKEALLIRQLFTEIRGELSDRVIAFRNHFRYVQTYEPVRLTGAGTDSAAGLLREGGTYLITGGLGGIGLVLARYLASVKEAKLVLTGRSALPKREDWQQWLNLHGAHEKVSRQIRRVQEMEKAGAEVLTFAADVADFQQMETVIAEAEKRLGTINGVIHAAGVPGGGMMQLKKPGQARQVMAAKIDGTLVLDRVLANRPLDFVVLCSSISSILPMMGQVDYFAANAFLNAFAYYKTFRDGTPTISIDWDTWQEVGMAVEAARRLMGPGKQEGKHLDEFPGQDSGHLFLGRLVEANPQQDVYVSRFTMAKQWVLDEHKITETGNGLVPGVTYLEMARKAFEKYAHNGGVEIKDVYFFNPLMVGEKEEKEVRFILKKPAAAHEVNPGAGTGSNGYDFLVESRAAAGGGNWQKHVTGTLYSLAPIAQPAIHDINEIISTCNRKKITTAANSGNKKESHMQRGLLIFGPRWQSVERIYLGEQRGAAFLHLDESFAGELDDFKLHPALLDSATAFLFSYVGGSAYIPFSYKQLIVKKPLKGKMFSFSRVIRDPGSESQSDILKFDITIMDENGVELVDIKEFTMLRVSDAVKGKIIEKEKPSAGETGDKTGDRDPVELTDKQKSYLRDGLLPAEGIEVFKRILGSSLPQVVVSATDLSLRQQEARSFTRVLQKEKAEDKKAPVELHPRPPLSTPYVPPETDMEQLVAGVWQELLGIGEIGIHDNFFELGGDSLNIVQLNKKIKNVLKREVPVAVMFSYLTIHSFVRYLTQKDRPEGSVSGEIDRSGEIEKSKNRMKAVKRQR